MPFTIRCPHWARSTMTLWSRFAVLTYRQRFARSHQGRRHPALSTPWWRTGGDDDNNSGLNIYHIRRSRHLALPDLKTRTPKFPKSQHKQQTNDISCKGRSQRIYSHNRNNDHHWNIHHGKQTSERRKAKTEGPMTFRSMAKDTIGVPYHEEIEGTTSYLTRTWDQEQQLTRIT